MLAAAMVAVLVLAGSLIVATEGVDAQSTTTLVSNQGTSPFDSNGEVGPGLNDLERATAFTTGTNEAGYGLASVTLELRKRTGAAGNPPEVAIHSDRNGSPGGSLVTFENPSNISSLNTSHADYTFSAPQPSPGLRPNTTYWVMLYVTGNALQVKQTGFDGKNSGNQDDWSIGDDSAVRIRDSGSAYGVDDHVFRMSLGGVLLTRTNFEPSAWDFPYSDETWGYVDTSNTSTGRMDATLDSGRRTGDWWKLRVEPHRRYRVQVQFGSGSSHARGGGIDVNYDPALWDHNRDDGRAFIEFYASPESYHLRVRARDMLNDDSRSFYGRYAVNLTDISGITKKVSNGNEYTNLKHQVDGSSDNVNSWLATSFTTGANTGGYKLSYVGTGLETWHGVSSVKAALYTNSSGSPGTKIFDFERIGAITSRPTAQYSDRFWAPTGTTLTASTTYWVVFKDENYPNSSYLVAGAESGTDNPGAASGWSIGDSVKNYNSAETSPSWIVQNPSKPLVLEVFAANVVTGSASEAVDQTAPELQSATVDGSSLTLAYDETLDSVAVSSSAFTVNVNGSPRSVLVAAVAQSNVLLHLSAPVEVGDTVTVDYTVPTDEEAGRVQDASGNAAGSLSGQAVTNETTASGGGGGGERSDEPDPPGVPESLDVALQQSGRLKATWTAPGSGPAPTGYTVQWRAAVDAWDDPDVVSETEVTQTSYVIGGLTDGVEYTARVVATRDGADSAPSGEVTAIPQETTPPGLSSASVDGAELTLTFDEALDTGDAPETSAFAVTVAGAVRGVDAVTVSGSAATLTLATAVVAGDAVMVDYTAPTGESESRLQDEVGNAAASFSGQSVTNNTQAAVPLTATTLEVPANHDGRGTFTFELHFSESPKRLFSYQTLRYHAFTLTGGEVTHVRRLQRGSNMRWEIRVRPDGNGAVTIALPATTDCEADGAVCTDDSRMLSQGFEFEVPGLNTPEITSGSSFSVEEGATQVATLSATDGDTPAADLTWSVSGGDDEAKFALTAAGVLSFAAAKDYETPDDADTDGVYEVTVQVSDGGRTDSADLTVTLTDVNEAPTADAGADQENVIQGDTVTLNGSGADPDAGEVFSFAWVQTSGATVTLSDTAAALPTFTAPTGQTGDVELIFTLRVADDEGLFAEDSVTVAINGQLPLDPLTADAHGVPTAHDGSTAFTFELRLSEEPADGFSYKTLRDHAFAVTGGEVAKVRRLETGKNVRWEISVTPDGDGPVTIVLPATTDCGAAGAVCTEDGRMLSNRLEVTVPGP